MSMDFPNYFADANANRSEAECIIFGVPFGLTSSFRLGADQGPQAIRQASWNFETFDLRSGIDLEDIKIHDYGDLDIGKKDSKTVVDTTRKFTESLLNERKFPIALGGEHAITPGVIAAYPQDYSVLVLDAHLDFRTSYEHNQHNHACVVRRIADHLAIENIAVLGVRSAEKAEFDQAVQAGLFFKDIYTIRKNKLPSSIAETKKRLQGKPVYLSLDIDVVDPAYAPGTSTPEPFGLTPLEVIEIIDAFSDQLVGFDVVEVCPPYDQGQTALLAAKLIRMVLCKVWKNKI